MKPPPPPPPAPPPTAPGPQASAKAGVRDIQTIPVTSQKRIAIRLPLISISAKKKKGRLERTS
jgi:hypothetical protein